MSEVVATPEDTGPPGDTSPATRALLDDFENPRLRDTVIAQDDADMAPANDTDAKNPLDDVAMKQADLCRSLEEDILLCGDESSIGSVGLDSGPLNTLRDRNGVSSATESDDDDIYVETSPLASQSDILRTELDKPLPPVMGTSFSGEHEDVLHLDPDSRDSCDPRVDFLSACHKAADQAEELVHRVWEAGWRVVHHRTLPKWLKDNDFLLMGHRPPTYSFSECFKSVFRIHTETGNIWTHLLGFVAFVAITLYFLTRPSIEIQIQEKAVFSPFFFGAILCLGFSTLFHTLFCHSEKVGKLFNKLDYCGISLLTMGSFVPWLYYSFYCRLKPKITYLVLIFILGTCSIVVSLWDKFSTPQYRCLRAGVFIALGLSGVIPALHYVITDGFYHAITFASLGWLVLMAVLYIAGAIIYAARIPERLFPGKFDIWFQSHQIFHVFVVAAAFVHYHGISEIATYRLTGGDCVASDLQ